MNRRVVLHQGNTRTLATSTSSRIPMYSAALILLFIGLNNKHTHRIYLICQPVATLSIYGPIDVIVLGLLYIFIPVPGACGMRGIRGTASFAIAIDTSVISQETPTYLENTVGYYLPTALDLN
ncbi:hypothetical protein Trydic_g4 [Trypoxylus dichotomus]